MTELQSVNQALLDDVSSAPPPYHQSHPYAGCAPGSAGGQLPSYAQYTMEDEQNRQTRTGDKAQLINNDM